MSDGAPSHPTDEGQARTDRVFANPNVVQAIVRLEEDRKSNPNPTAMSRDDFLSAFG